MSLQAIPEGPLRSGYTTGANATACAKAAVLALIQQQPVAETTITLPVGEQVTFTITSCTFSTDEATCTTVKDAGDDPDVTHGATIGCTVRLNDTGAIRFFRGEGVGLITLPGLAFPPGEPAINPVPRRMMAAAIRFVLHMNSIDKGVDVEVFVVNGEALAARTLNSRIGIMGGLSILGTTGIVRPFSAAAYVASITQGIDVALACGCKELVINSGGRSEKLLRARFADLPEQAFVQYGNWIGETLGKIRHTELRKTTMGIMIGKAVKLASGELDTHSGKSSWDPVFVAQLAASCGYPESVQKAIKELHMARRLTTLFPFNETEPFYRALMRKCHAICRPLIPSVQLDIILIDADDQFISFTHTSLL